MPLETISFTPASLLNSTVMPPRVESTPLVSREPGSGGGTGGAGVSSSSSTNGITYSQFHII